MSKGYSPKLKDALCDISVDVFDVCYTLPRPVESDDIFILKLKKKARIQRPCLI